MSVEDLAQQRVYEIKLLKNEEISVCRSTHSLTAAFCDNLQCHVWGCLDVSASYISCCLLHSVSKEEGHIYMANINLIQSPFTSSLHSQVPNPCPNSNYTFKTRTQKKCERCKKIKILHHTVGLKMLLTKIALFSMVSSHRWLLCLEEELQPATLTHTHTFSECILVAVLSNFMAVTPLGDVRKL